MKLVAVINENTKNNIQGTEYVDGIYYNPVEYNENWIISFEEAQYLGDPSLIVDIVTFVAPEIEEE